MSLCEMKELYAELDRYVKDNLNLLLAVEKCWQPSDLLPNFAAEDWLDQLKAYRETARNLPDDILITLVANVITEEALPSYHSWLSRLGPGFDKSGADQGGIAQWMRGWVAEEKRHGDVLARYLYFSGLVDYRSIELSIQHLIRNGFDPLTENCIFQGFIYTSFQERATFISHAGVAREARKHGEHNLARICDQVAGDEARHEKAYERFVGRLFELDSDRCMLAMASMLRKTVIMPSRMMTDGVDDNIFSLFSAITQRNGIYTVVDYAKIMDHLVRLWKIETQTFQTAEARQAQEFVARLPARYFRMAERAIERPVKIPKRPISWIHDRVVNMP